MIREPNHPRKATRVAIPLLIEIDGQSHAVRDWSTSGIAVAGLAQVPQPGELLQGTLHFPMLESTLLMPVQLVFRRLHEDICGFEFHELSPRNRRILRHYIDLSAQGKLGDVEDVVAVDTLPSADQWPQPQAAVPLPPQALLTPHRSRPWGALLVGVAVLAGVLGIGWYQLTYELEGTGFVSGSMARVTANHEGRIARLLVQPGARVERDTPLFAVENPGLRDEIVALEEQVARLTQEQARIAGEQARLESARRQAQAGLLQSLRRDYDERQRELANARRLLEAGAITQREVLQVADQASALRRSYLQQVADAVERPQPQRTSEVLDRLRLELATKKVQLARQESERMVRSPVRGKVFHVERHPGEFVSAQSPVLLLEADSTPSVLLRVPDEDALKLRLGMAATIYVPFEDRRHAASVAAVGHAAAAGAAGSALEAASDGTLVRLEFDDRQVRLPANARVNVWIRNPALPWSS